MTNTATGYESGFHAGMFTGQVMVVTGGGSGIGRFGPITGLVNCAGGQFPAPLRDISLNGWNAVIANNLPSSPTI